MKTARRVRRPCGPGAVPGRRGSVLGGMSPPGRFVGCLSVRFFPGFSRSALNTVASPSSHRSATSRTNLPPTSPAHLTGRGTLLRCLAASLSPKTHAADTDVEKKLDRSRAGRQPGQFRRIELFDALTCSCHSRAVRLELKRLESVTPHVCRWLLQVPTATFGPRMAIRPKLSGPPLASRLGKEQRPATLAASPARVGRIRVSWVLEGDRPLGAALMGEIAGR